MPMNVKPDQSRLTTLLTDTVVLLCKNGLNFQGTLRIVGVLGITIDDNDVFIVHVNENVSSVAPDTLPDVTSYSDAVDQPKTTSVGGCRSFPAEKRTLMHHSPRTVKSSGRVSNKCIDDPSHELRSKGSALLEDGLMKTDRGDHTSEIHIKEENVEVTSAQTANRNLSYGREQDEDCSMPPVSKRERRTFKWTREIGHVSISDPTDHGNETFAQNCEGRAAESRGGVDVADEWNLDMLALSSLPGTTEGDAVPPWPGYVWAAGSYPQDCLSGEISHAQSQSMVGLKTRVVRDGLTQPDVERHGFALLKPFACPIEGCNRRFYHRNNVYRHRKQKHGEHVLGFANRRR